MISKVIEFIWNIITILGVGVIFWQVGNFWNRVIDSGINVVLK